MKMQDEECKSVPLCTLFEGHEATHEHVTQRIAVKLHDRYILAQVNHDLLPLAMSCITGVAVVPL